MASSALVNVTVGPVSAASARVWAAASRRTLDAVKARPDLGLPDDVMIAFESYLDAWTQEMDGSVFVWSGDVDPDVLRHLAANWARLVNLARDDSENGILRADPGGQEFYDALATAFIVALAKADDAERFAAKFEEVVPEFNDVHLAPSSDVLAFKPVRVLLVDDHPDIRLLVRIGLESYGGFDIVGEAEDGQEAIDRVCGEGCCPDAVVLDLTMPVMDGMTALPKILEHCPGTRVLVFSANDSAANRTEAFGLGAAAFLRKDAGIADIALALREQ